MRGNPHPGGDKKKLQGRKASVAKLQDSPVGPIMWAPAKTQESPLVILFAVIPSP